jgi:hypothetical protein
MNQLIENKIKELYDNTPEYVSVAFGKKKINNIFTDENCFVFMVEEKKPLKDIPENEILPTSIEVDSVSYKTDVWNIGKINIIPCNQNVLDNCYDWKKNQPLNQRKIRPLKGGISITSNNTKQYVGTLGFIAVDNETNALVGVTNAHVQVGNLMYTDEREIGNEDNDESNLTFQSGESGAGIMDNMIGETIRYVPITNKRRNQVDGALISLKSNDISNTESFKQHGLPYDLPMPFASSQEINSLLLLNPKIYSSGRTTGVKGNDTCGLMVTATNGYTYIGGYEKNSVSYTEFNGIIFFNRLTSDCPYPIYDGDSGSALIADLNGVWKIIGLVFAGGTDIGCACRIDVLSQQLGISSWDGTPKRFIDVNSKSKKTLVGGSGQQTLICDEKTYSQMGSTFDSFPC